MATVARIEMFRWLEAKAVARCACDDPDRMECENFDVPSTTVDGNEACSCVCHKVEQLIIPKPTTTVGIGVAVPVAQATLPRAAMLWEDIVTLAKRENRSPSRDGDLLLSAALLDFNAAVMCGSAKLPASWAPVAVHAAGYETECGEIG